MLLCKDIMKSVRHKHVVCMELHFPTWYERLLTEMDEALAEI